MIRTLTIGGITLPNQLLAAPMAGFSDKASRLIARGHGCALAVSEMVSSEAVLYNNRRTYTYFDLEGEQPPVAVQIFGSDPERMAQAAVIVARCGAALIDINLGCPTPKIVKNGEGCALMRDPVRAAAIIKAVCSAVDLPVTVKMRKGWDSDQVNAVELACLAEENGAAAVTVHGRTRSQFYHGPADWQIIKEVQQAVDIPVIGNGDLFTPLDVVRMLEETGCRGAMLARGAMGNPWLFDRTLHLLATGELFPEPTPGQRIAGAIEHFDLALRLKGEQLAVPQMRKVLSCYIKGLPGAGTLRAAINTAATAAEVRRALVSFAHA